MWVLCLCCLYFTASACLLAIFARSYDDNLGMRVGMAVLCLSCLGRAIRLQHEQTMSPDAAMVVLGIAIFAAGSGWRHVRWRQADRRQVERRQTHRRLDEITRSAP